MESETQLIVILTGAILAKSVLFASQNLETLLSSLVATWLVISRLLIDTSGQKLIHELLLVDLLSHWIGLDD